MKLAILTLGLLFLLGMNVSAQETFKLRTGQQKVTAKSGLTIRFVGVTEDNRCPVDTDCVWAGNAKIKVRISSPRMTKTFEFNTDAGPKGDILDGWAIYLDELTPKPHSRRKITARQYTALFRVERLTR